MRNQPWFWKLSAAVALSAALLPANPAAARIKLITLPPRERIVWQETETIAREEEWVDTNYGVDGSGHELVLDLQGQAKLNFAEVTFANGNVQVVDFDEQSHGNGTYKLLDLSADQHVMTVRLLARSESDDTKVSVYLSK